MFEIIVNALEQFWRARGRDFFDIPEVSPQINNAAASSPTFGV